jgi:hypothetical protein
VITESTADLAATTHIFGCSCGMYFSAAASSENAPGSMNLASNTAPVASTRPPRFLGRHSVAIALPREISDRLGVDLR